MIDLTKVSELKFDKVVDKIEDINGLVIYEGWKNLTANGIPPLTLIKCKGADLVDYKIYGNTVQEGTPAIDTPIEIQNVGEKTENLFDNSNLLINQHYVTTGTLGNNTGRIATPKINVATIDTISVKYSVDYKVNIAFLGWDKDGNLLERSVTKIYNKTYGTIDVSQFYQIAFFWWYSGVTIVEGDIYDVMICEGSEVLDYIPYGYKIPVKVNDTITDIILKEPLRKLGSYADYIDFANQKVVRNLIAKYFDETSQLSSTGLVSGSDGIYRYFITSNDFLKQNSGVGGYCTHLPATNTYNSTVPSVKYGWSNVMVYIFLPYTTLAECRVFFAEQLINGTPFGVIIPRAEPLEETVELPTIPTIKGTTIIDIDTTVQPSNVEVVYKGKE